MRRSASEILRNLETRIARLERQASTKTARLNMTAVRLGRRAMSVLEREMMKSLKSTFLKKVEIFEVKVSEDAEMMTDFGFVDNPNDEECYVNLYCQVSIWNAEGYTETGRALWTLDLDPNNIEFDRHDEPTSKSVSKAIELEAKDVVLEDISFSKSSMGL